MIRLYGFESELVEWQITTLSAMNLRELSTQFRKLGSPESVLWRSSKRPRGWPTAAGRTVDLLFSCEAVKCLGELLPNRIADDAPAVIAIKTNSATSEMPHLAHV
jgi:hypothetical protein